MLFESCVLGVVKFPALSVFLFFMVLYVSPVSKSVSELLLNKQENEICLC